MKRVHREGIDVSSVILGSAKRLKNKIAHTNVYGIQDASHQRVISIRTWIKKTLRAFAQFGFRLTKSTLRPVAFEFRRFLIDGLRQDITPSRHSQSANNVLDRLERIEQFCSAAARRIAINCGQGEIMVRTEVGFVLCSATDHALLAAIIETGETELGTRLLIQEFLRPGDFFVDVGANIGMHTLAAARAMQGQGKITAFEPFEPTKRLLEKSIWMNGFAGITEIHQAAVSNASGRRSLYLGATSGHHSLFDLEAFQRQSPERVEVPLVRLDEIICSDRRVDLLKVDVEGAELEVLEGGASLITNSPDIALVVGFGPSHLRRTGRTATEWLNAFTKLGLRYRVINESTGALEDWPLERLQEIESVNLFFSRKESSAWSRLQGLFA